MFSSNPFKILPQYEFLYNSDEKRKKGKPKIPWQAYNWPSPYDTKFDFRRFDTIENTLVGTICVDKYPNSNIMTDIVIVVWDIWLLPCLY